jgi:hypothetical protein
LTIIKVVGALIWGCLHWLIYLAICAATAAMVLLVLATFFDYLTLKLFRYREPRWVNLTLLAVAAISAISFGLTIANSLFNF